ncbi:carbohydrate binding domain-containing protein [Cohnella soli]|uniref:Carbohydrate binding domain-containing protein n=1 Tax=Cohnella soli TaxID=425005 RepID=A0ABW0HUI8_9BACL
MRFRNAMIAFMALTLSFCYFPPQAVHAAGNIAFSYDLNHVGKVVTNKSSNVDAWGLGKWSTVAADLPPDSYSANDPYTKTVELMIATGGSTGRDLFVDTDDITDLTDYKFKALVEACANILRQGLKPKIKLGNVPLKFSADPLLKIFEVNVRPPDDYKAYYNYVKAIADQLKNHFGIDEVRTWTWGVLTEYDNSDWFDAGDANSTKIAYYKLYDYSVAALEDSLGAENVDVGAHSMFLGGGYWDARDFLNHCKNGTNYARGTVGTQIDYASISFYDNYPIGFDTPVFLNTINAIRNYANSIGLTGMKFGVDEGRILMGWDGKGLPTRDVQHPMQGSSDAKMFKVLVDNDVDWFAQWDGGNITDNGVRTLSGNMRNLLYKMTNGRVAEVTRTGTPTGSTDEVDSMASYNDTTHSIHVFAYNNNADKDANTVEPVTINLNHIEPVSGNTVTVKKWIVDDTHANWWATWWQDQTNRGLTDSDYLAAWSKYSGLPFVLLNQSDKDYFNSRGSVYKSLGDLAYTTQNVAINGNALTFTDNIEHHGVVFYEITNVKNAPVSLPGQAGTPSPASAATNVSTAPQISWTAGSGAVSHDIYFGTSSTPPFVQNQTGTVYNPGKLKAGTTYYLRIDERGTGGTAQGAVWSFTTTAYSDELLNNPGFENGTTGWTIDSSTLTSVTSPVHGGSKAVKVTNRADRYTGPRQNIKDLLAASGKGNYAVSTWLKAGTGSMDGLIQIWIKSNGGQESYYYQDLKSFSDWTQVSSTLNLTWTGALEDAQMRIFTGDGQVEDFYVDDASMKKVARTSPLINNPGFENGTTGWLTDSCVLTSVTSPVHGESKAVKVTDRADRYTGPRQDIKDVLAANGKGYYTVSAWLKAETGSMDGLIQVWVKSNGGQENYYYTPLTNFKDWTEVASRINVTWTGNLEAAQLRILTGNGQTGNFYADDVALKKVGEKASPDKATNPYPSTGRTRTILAPELTWTAGSRSASHDVYFGTSSSPPFVRNQTGTTYTPGTLEAGTTYYWRVDERNDSGITVGPVWSFTTLDAAPELLNNHGFEADTNGWVTDGASTLTSVTDPVHEGAKSVHVTSRLDEYGGPRQNIKDILTGSGQGDYDLSAWLKAGTGNMNGVIQIWVQYDGGKQTSYTQGLSGFGDWTKLFYKLNVTWTGTLEAAQLRIFTGSGQLGDFYVDDVSLKKEGPTK